MSGIFGVVASKDCIEPLLYGTDYHSHLGTQYGGMAVWGEELVRKIHSIRTSQFKSKFYEEKHDLEGNKGIGAVSASHTIIEVGDEPTVSVGDTVTLLGPDHPDIHPNAVASATGRSVYDIFMHLNPGLLKVIV